MVAAMSHDIHIPRVLIVYKCVFVQLANVLR